MKERPILFSASMIRALLNGTKTQTRRVVKPQFAADALPVEMPAIDPAWGWVIPGHSGVWWCDAAANPDDLRRCPYGQPGDRLWVRESWRAPLAYELTPPRDIQPGTPIAFQADGAGTLPHINVGKLRPGMFMPRWASRILLEITDVRVERLQDINEADAVAEGSFTWAGEQDTPVRDLIEARLVYRQLWEQINGTGSWDAIPWVWAVSFRRLP